MTPLTISPGPEADLTIATFTNDRPEVLAAFVARHQVQGVKHLRLYFDNPDNAFIPVAQQLEGVTAIPCDDAFWGAKRPPKVEGRQMRCFKHAYEVAETPWIGFCDGDEAFVANPTFAGQIAAAEDDELIQGFVWEAFWPEGTPCDDLFSATHARRPVWNAEKRAELLPPNTIFESIMDRGVVGHPWGKVILRRGIKHLKITVHSAKIGRPDSPEAREIKRSNQKVHLLHYDAMSVGAWADKHARRLSGATQMGGNRMTRNLQTDIFALCETEASRERFFRAMYGLDQEAVARLSEEGVVREISHDPTVLGRMAEILALV